MVSLCLYFQVHQPYRTKNFTIFDIGKDIDAFSTDNLEILEKVCKKSYLPTNKILLELLEKHPEFKVTFSFSGVLLEQLEESFPEVLDSFKALVDTGRVEILDETYYHSLAFLHSRGEFREQVRLHRELMKRLFGVVPRVFRNTELVYNNDIAREIELMGYSGILSEGSDDILKWRSPNFVYRPSEVTKVKLLLKNYRLSDDIAFRFSQKDWSEWPLTISKYVDWINNIKADEDVVNLFMDYETFGEHHWEDTGIFDFLRALPEEILKNPENNFMTPSEVIDNYPEVGTFDSPDFISWADLERDLSAWLGNDMQKASMKKVYALSHKVFLTNDPKIIHDWRRLQTSDHYYYMCTKWFTDGNVHKYFSPYKSPYDAFISFMNVLHDLEIRISRILKEEVVEAVTINS